MSTGMSSRYTELDRALDITRRMLACAQSGDWDAVIRLETQRRECMGSSGLMSVAPRDMLEEMLTLNEAVVALVEQQRHEASAQLRKVQQGRLAVPAYENCGYGGFALK